MSPTLAEVIAANDNDYRPIVDAFVHRTGTGWHQRTAAELSRDARISIVMPTCNNTHSLRRVLDALSAQQCDADVELIAVDDASTDDTADLLRTHPRVDHAIQLPARHGAGAARNLGVYLAGGVTIVFLDADIVVPDHVISDFAARATDNVVLTGFRHNVAYRPGPDGIAHVPAGEPDLDQDHRSLWKPRAGTPMFYSGQIYPNPFTGRPLQDTDDLLKLGNGASYYDWDLPRMFVTALAAAPRRVFLDVGGFDPGFTETGWGSEDTYLGAALIGAGCKIIPVRQARGWHIDPPDADAAWAQKLAGTAPRVHLYRRLLQQPAPAGREADLVRRAEHLLRDAVTLR